MSVTIPIPAGKAQTRGRGGSEPGRQDSVAGIDALAAAIPGLKSNPGLKFIQTRALLETQPRQPHQAAASLAAEAFLSQTPGQSLSPDVLARAAKISDKEAEQAIDLAESSLPPR